MHKFKINLGLSSATVRSCVLREVWTGFHLCLAVVVCIALTSNQASSESTYSLKVGRGGVINLTAHEVPVRDILNGLSQKNLLEVRGMIPSGIVSLQLSNSQLEEVLSSLLKGHNYALMQTGPSDRPVLIVMGRAERSPYQEAVAPATRQEVTQLPAIAAAPPGLGPVQPGPGSVQVAEPVKTVETEPSFSGGRGYTGAQASVVASTATAAQSSATSAQTSSQTAAATQTAAASQSAAPAAASTGGTADAGSSTQPTADPLPTPAVPSEPESCLWGHFCL